MKDLFKKPLFVVLLIVLVALIGTEISSLRFSLAERLISTDDAVRNQALSEIPKLVPDKREQLIVSLIKQQEHAKPKPRRFALYAIRVAGGKTPEVISILAGALSDNDPHVRSEAQMSLMEMGEPALPVVASAAKGKNDVAREGALVILEKAGSAGVPYLTGLLQDTPSRVLPIIEILTRLGEIAKSAVPKLIALFETPDANLRLEAALAANSIQRPAPEALPVLLKALNDRPWDAKSVEIVHSLEDMGLVAKSAAPDLTKQMLSSKESFTDKLAPKPVLAQALSELDGRRAELVDLGFDLKQKNVALRYRAAYTLSVMDPPSTGALEMLVGAVGDSDPTVAARVLVALKRIGLEKTERLGPAAKRRIDAAAARVNSAGVEGFSSVY